MDLASFVLSRHFAVATAGVLLGLTAISGGIGYRSMARALGITVIAAIPAGFGLGFVGALAGLWMSGRGEGAGAAALVLGVAVGVVAAAATLGAGFAFVYRRRVEYLVRGPLSPGLLMVGSALILYSFSASLLRIPAFRSDRSLTTQLGSGFDVQKGGAAREEILARGRAAVPELRISLQKVEQSGLYTFEDGRNQGAKAILELLGELGGPDAIVTLRAWLNSDYAPDVRAAAARALGRAGDAESAAAIGALLEYRDYEWRSCHFDLVLALGGLRAAAELPHLRSALVFEAKEEGTSFQISLIDAGVQTLVAIDTAEAWAILRELADGGSASRREAVVRALGALNRTLEPGKAEESAGADLPRV